MERVSGDPVTARRGENEEEAVLAGAGVGFRHELGLTRLQGSVRLVLLGAKLGETLGRSPGLGSTVAAR